MRWPFTTYGTGTLLAFSLPLIALTGLLARGLEGWWWVVPLPLLAFVLSFFRDPERTAAGGEDDLVSPADGLVADITTVDDPQLGPGCTRIGIFLSVFNVHVNRSPCTGEIEQVTHRDGGFLDARDPRATEENQAATIVLARPDGRRLAVRQITGLIARKIICPARVGQRLSRGERYGMIRFGSRTELVLATDEIAALSVAVGDTVKGGETLLARLHAKVPQKATA
jgi:phosphatidylserine decarboxylase